MQHYSGFFWQVTSIGFHGNVVSVWEKLAQEYENSGQLLVELGSDQTSCHNPHSGGYYPVQLTYSEAQEVFFLFVCPVLNCTRAIDPADDLMENVGFLLFQMLAKDPGHFKELVGISLRRQISAINRLAEAGMFFWDYGNAFLLEARRSGADVSAKDDPTGLKFRYPSYVQDIMGYTPLSYSKSHRGDLVGLDLKLEFFFRTVTSSRWVSAHSAGCALRVSSRICS